MSHPRTWITRSIALVALLSLLSTSLATASPRSSAINPVAGPDDPSREAVGDPDTPTGGSVASPMIDGHWLVQLLLRLTNQSMFRSYARMANTPECASTAARVTAMRAFRQHLDRANR